MLLNQAGTNTVIKAIHGRNNTEMGQPNHQPPCPRVPASPRPPVSPRPRVPPSRRLPVSLSPLLPVALLLTVFFMTLPLTALAQPGVPGPRSPLYGARPETGPPASGLPTALKEVGLDQKLNEQLPLDLVFRDEQGEAVKLGDYFGKRPVLLALVYYECPMLCNQVLNGVVTALRVLAFQAGKEFDIVTVSFDPRETAALAEAKKRTYVDYLQEEKRAAAASGWHFLTGDAKSIGELTSAVGFRYYFDEKTDQFAHASGIMLATADGKLARYFYGIDYSARDLRLGLIETSENKIGSPVDQLLLYCYHYDPATGKYGAVVMNMVRLGGILTLIAIVIMFVVLRRRSATRMRHAGGEA